MFVTIATVMTLGILSGPVYCLFGFKAYDKKVLSKAKANDEIEVVETETKKQKKSFGPILFDAVFIAMISSFLAVDIAKLFDSEKTAPIDTYVPAVVIIVTFISMALFDLLEKKFKLKWLSSFSLGLSMIIGMAAAVILG